MLDVNDFIKERGGDPAKIKESQRRRHAPEAVVDEVIAMFDDHRTTQYAAATEMGAKINAVQKAMAQNKKSKGDPREFDRLKQQKDELAQEKLRLERLAADKYAQLQKKAKTIGNYVHATVPVSDTEDDNQVIRKWAPDGFVEEKRDCMSHHDVLVRLGGADFDRGVKIVGHRGNFLTGNGLRLKRALESYALDFLDAKGYILNQPPFFMLRDQMAKTAQLEQFDEELYKVTEKENDPASDKYLIATSEQPISAMHADEWLNPTDLPIRYAGSSTCFRKEAGSHGKDAWGIFRVHQFEKIEQFVFCSPDDSWKHFDEMIGFSEEFYRSLDIPYRVVAIVSGALNNAAAKKYDLEAWFPFQGEYKELVSCSNCTDYQTRELEIRFGQKKQTDPSYQKAYVHALNSTLCAVQRALCCIMENYQRPDHMLVPPVLRPYLRGHPATLPYLRHLPHDSTSLKAQAAAAAAAAATHAELPHRPKLPAQDSRS